VLGIEFWLMVVRRDAREGLVTRILVWISMIVVLADVVAYVLIIRTQGDSPPDAALTVPFVTGYMLLMAALLWLSLVDRPPLVSVRPALRAFAAAGLLVLGVLAAFSIGVAIFAPGVLAAIAAIRALAGPRLGRSVLSEIVAAALAVTILIAGFEVTQRVIVCPPTGTMGGGGSGFLTSPYHYTCVNGTLTWYSGDCNGVSQGFDADGNPTSTNGC
jgi:hypothetical protein